MGLTKKPTLWVSSYIKWIEMYMCTLNVCWILYYGYHMYCILVTIFTFWKQWKNVSQGTRQLATWRDPLQDTRREVFPNLVCTSGGSEAPQATTACVWILTNKVTPPFPLLFYWTPHPHKPGLWCASLSLRPSPQCWARHAGPTLAGFLEAPMARLHRVTSACFAKNRTWLLLT